MIWKDLNLFNIIQCINKLPRFYKILIFIRNSRNQDMPNPNRFFHIRKFPKHLLDVIKRFPSKLNVFLRINVLNVNQEQVGNIHNCLPLGVVRLFSGKRCSACIYACRNTRFPAPCKKFQKEVKM